MKRKILSWLWLLFVAVAGACAIGLTRDSAYAEINNINYGTIQQRKSHQTAPVLPTAQPSSHSVRQGKTTQSRVHVTSFSSKECRTPWCNAHRGQGRTYVAAVNAKFGKPKQIYIAAYDRTYEVIGTTDSHTDIDLWFGDDYEGAIDFGSKQLLTTFFY